MATDPRSMGAQVDDETIEIKLQSNPIVMRDDRHVNVTSYNGVVLLVGAGAQRGRPRSRSARSPRPSTRVRSVNNELAVGPNTQYSVRSNDSFITGKVKTRLFDEGKIAPNAVKVVTEDSVVYLMGMVSRAEGAKAGEIAATTSGVARVVKVFEYTN